MVLVYEKKKKNSDVVWFLCIYIYIYILRRRFLHSKSLKIRRHVTEVSDNQQPEQFTGLKVFMV